MTPLAGTSAANAGGGAKRVAGLRPEERLRALLPKLWWRFRGPSVATGGTGSASCAAVAELPLRALRAWLLGNAGEPGHAWTSDRVLRRALCAVAAAAPLRSRAGIRRKDRSIKREWSVKNVIGYSETSGKEPLWQGSEVSWYCYVATFELSMPGFASVELRRTLEPETIAARVEKRFRGDPGGPLIKERVKVTARTDCDSALQRGKRMRVEKSVVDLLPAVILRPTWSPHDWTLIYLHGIASPALENYGDRPYYFLDGSVAVKVVLPTAPSRELSCSNVGWDKVPARCSKEGVHQVQAWYDYTSKHEGKREDALNYESLCEIQKAIHSVIRSEASELGGRFDRVIVAGKSQGCCAALHAALAFPDRLGGFIGVAGQLLSHTRVEPGGPQTDMPIHLFHEPEDNPVHWKCVQDGMTKLRDAGFRVYSLSCRDSEGHSDYTEGLEGNWVCSALRLICSGSAACGMDAIEDSEVEPT